MQNLTPTIDLSAAVADCQAVVTDSLAQAWATGTRDGQLAAALVAATRDTDYERMLVASLALETVGGGVSDAAYDEAPYVTQAMDRCREAVARHILDAFQTGASHREVQDALQAEADANARQGSPGGRFVVASLALHTLGDGVPTAVDGVEYDLARMGRN